MPRRSPRLTPSAASDRRWPGPIPTACNSNRATMARATPTSPSFARDCGRRSRAGISTRYPRSWTLPSASILAKAAASRRSRRAAAQLGAELWTELASVLALGGRSRPRHRSKRRTSQPVAGRVRPVRLCGDHRQRRAGSRGTAAGRTNRHGRQLRNRGGPDPSRRRVSPGPARDRSDRLRGVVAGAKRRVLSRVLHVQERALVADVVRRRRLSMSAPASAASGIIRATMAHEALAPPTASRFLDAAGPGGVLRGRAPRPAGPGATIPRPARSGGPAARHPLALRRQRQRPPDARARGGLRAAGPARASCCCTASRSWPTAGAR